MRRLSLLLPLSLCLQAGDTGLTPRSSPADYPVYQSASSSTIAAVRVKSEQVAKTLSTEIDRNYVVVEVAVYPKGGATVDVQYSDFALRFAGREETFPDMPKDTSVPWRENGGIKDRVQVTTGTSVIVATQKDPVNGRQTSVGTYERVGVGVGNPGPPDPPRPGPDPSVVEGKLQARALPQGKTSMAVAGYLYFPRLPKNPKNSSSTLVYSKDGKSIDLTLPVK